MSDSFSHKKIDVILKLANNQVFNDVNNNTLTVSGLRVEADIKNAGMLGSGSKARVKIYGLALSDMNKLMVIVNPNQPIQQNFMTLMAGDTATMTCVFGGQIAQAWADLSGSPESCLTIDAIPGYADQMATAEATSTQADRPVGDMMADLANKMGLAFVNQGVDGKLSKMTLKGSLIDQARTVATAANIFWEIRNNQTLIISKPKTADETAGTILLNEHTGLLGYPAFSSQGISLTTLFNPALSLRSKIRLETPLTPCEGEWLVQSVSYRLESEKAGGAWFCQLECARPITTGATT